MTVEKIVVRGGARLEGTVQISGAKNAALPILCATLLTNGTSILRNVPNLKDVSVLVSILRNLGVRLERRPDGSIEAEVEDTSKSTAPYEHVRRMRASIGVLGPLVAARGEARVSLPGGCVIGLRPVDLHLKGLRALGVDIQIEHGYIVARAEKLHGAHIYLGGPMGSTVLGTANVMMAASRAFGKTVIEQAACEPEIVDLANYLNAMGATIEGAGTPRLVITGVPELKGVEHTVIPDRIEAGTYLIAGAMTGGRIKAQGARADHLMAFIDKLREVGCMVEAMADGVLLEGPERIQAGDMTTLPYPGYPTDLQAQLMALMSVADGISVITEKVYPDRFMHLAELNRLGADIRKEGSSAIIRGMKELSGAPVMASDLRASAALVLAGLVARGRTEVRRVYHIDRGYEEIEKKLRGLGARIERKVEEDDF